VIDVMGFLDDPALAAAARARLSTSIRTS